MNFTSQAEITEWAARLNVLARTGRCAVPNFLKPFHLAMLALVVRESPAGIPMGNVTLPPALAGYACRMRLWDAIDRRAPIAVTEHPADGRFLPLEPLKVRSESFDSARKISEMARRFGADMETINSLEVSLAEVIENCFAHSEVTNGLFGVACAQSWEKGNLAQVAIADRGIGIRRSLRANQNLGARLAISNACGLATEFGITSKPGKGHAGYGLALTRQLLEEAGGALTVYSVNELFRTRADVSVHTKTDSSWDGTVVVLEWCCDRPLDIGAVYASWPVPEGFDDDDFDF